MKRLFLLLTLLATAPCLRAEARVTDVWAAQIPGTHQVRITYKLDAAAPCTVSVQVWIEGEPQLNVPATAFSGDFTQPTAVPPNLVSPGTNKSITLTVARTNSNGSREVLADDLDQKFTKNLRFKVLATESSGPPTYGDMVRIEGGPFQMGDQSNPPVGSSDELPVHTVQVSTFYMGKYEVSWGLWKQVRDWGRSNGYGLNEGAGKADEHPVHSITWHDMVKWCNARTEYENETLGTTATPCYTVSGAVYRTGNSGPECNWTANGYRLPTEAEWEKAARGGMSGKRFPWGDTITHSQANYRVYSLNGTTNFYSYDLTPRPPGTVYGYYHPTYNNGVIPYTSPVGSFALNGYGLYDMAGNLWEWCWDRYGSSYYSTSPGTDPRGPASGSYRVVRGGNWGDLAYDCRSAARKHGYYSDIVYYYDYLGFRPARSSVP